MGLPKIRRDRNMEAAPSLGFTPHSWLCSILILFLFLFFYYKTWVGHGSLNSIALVPSFSHPNRAMVDWHSPAEITRDAREVISPSTLIRAIHLTRCQRPLRISSTSYLAFTCEHPRLPPLRDLARLNAYPLSAGNSACHSTLITRFFPASVSFDGHW
jgi:hypothetical protein